MELWNKEVEKKFFAESVKFATPEQLFYITDKKLQLLLQQYYFTPSNEPDKIYKKEEEVKYDSIT